MLLTSKVYPSLWDIDATVRAGLLPNRAQMQPVHIKAFLHHLEPREVILVGEFHSNQHLSYSRHTEVLNECIDIFEGCTRMTFPEFASARCESSISPTSVVIFQPNILELDAALVFMKSSDPPCYIVCGFGFALRPRTTKRYRYLSPLTTKRYLTISIPTQSSSRLPLTITIGDNTTFATKTAGWCNDPQLSSLPNLFFKQLNDKLHQHLHSLLIPFLINDLIDIVLTYSCPILESEHEQYVWFKDELAKFQQQHHATLKTIS